MTLVPKSESESEKMTDCAQPEVRKRKRADYSKLSPDERNLKRFVVIDIDRFWQLLINGGVTLPTTSYASHVIPCYSLSFPGLSISPEVRLAQRF